ncbi:uncharacterized protein ACN2A1_012826 isoform 3-T8 [Glossina fuscipes fuscipes]
MEHLDLAGILTTPPQWNVPAFEQQDAIYLSSSRQMLEPIMEETSEDEEHALNSWNQYEQSTQRKEEGASFWSSAESETGSVIRIEINKDTDSISERDYLCPAKRARRCEELLQPNSLEEEVILRRPLYGEIKNNSLERFLAYENASRDSWGTGSQQRNSTGSRRFDEFYSDSDSLSYNSLSRSSSLIQFESLERQLMLQEQHTSMNSLGNSSPSLLSFDAQAGEESNSKTNISVSSNSSNNSRRGSQSSLLKRYESTDGRLHQTYYDLDKLNFDEMNTIRTAHSKFLVNNTELRSDSESSESTSSSSESSCRPNSVMSPVDSSDNDGLKIKLHTATVFQRRGSKNSAENLSEDSGYCEPTNWFNLRRSKSQNLLKSSEKCCEEIEQEQRIQETEATANPDKHSRNKSTNFYNILKIGDFESLPTATAFTKDFFIGNNNKSNSASIQPAAFIELSTLPEAIDCGRETTTGEKMLPPFYKNSTDERVITPNIHDNNDEKKQNENHADEENERSLTHSPSPASSETTSAASPASSRTSTDSSVTTCASAAFTWLRPPTRGAHDIETFTENSMPDIRDEKTSTTEETELLNIFCNGEGKINRNGRHNQLLNICDLLEVLRTGSDDVFPNTTTNELHDFSDFNTKKLETYCSNICATEKAENLMWCHGSKFSSVPNKLNELGNKTYENSFFNSEEEKEREKQQSETKSIQRSASWSVSFTSKSFPCKEDGATRGYMNASYYNLSQIKDFDIIDSFKMSDRKRTSLNENEIICKSNFLLNEVSKHYDRSASILTDKSIDCLADALQRPSVPLRNRKEAKANQNEMEYETIQHVQLVLRKPPARQRHKAGNAEKSLSLNQNMTIPGLDEPRKTFDQDPTNLKTSYAQSLERCNFDPKELSNHDLSTTTHRSLTKRRFHNQTNSATISKKKHLVSSTPNLNAYDYNQDIVEDDLYVSSAHTSMHQLPQNTTAKPLGILLPVGSRNSFNKEVSFCPVVSKYSWQEQSSAESNEPPALRSVNVETEDDSEDELLDNADATVIYNTKENENIAMRLKEEIDKLEIEESISKKERKSKSTTTLSDNSHDQEQEEEHTQKAISNTVHNENESENEMEVKHVSTTSIVSTTRNIITAVSSQQNVNNACLRKSAQDSISTIENKQALVKPTVIVARPLSIQLPMLTEPPINRAHHILYASQQMLDNLDKREDQEKDLTKFSENLKKMDYPISSKGVVTNTASSVYNNNNDIMKSKFKADEKHPSSKGFLARFANGFRFSLRRNKKKQLYQQQNTENLTLSSAVNNSTHFANKSPDFIYIPLKGPLPPKNNPSYPNGVNGNDCQPENGNAAKHKIGAKSMNAKEDEQKVTGKPPLPYKQTQKLQSAQSAQQQPQQQQQQQQQQQPIPASKIVGASRFYTDNYPDRLTSSTNEFLDTERSYYDNNNKQFTTILPMTSSEAATAVVVENFDSDNTANVTMTGVNIQNLPTEFSSPSRASVSQKTQMFNDLATKSKHLPLHLTPHQDFPDNDISSSSKIGLIETNLDTHETVITGKTRSLINIGPQQQKLHLHNTASGSGANSVGVKRINELTARRRMHLNDDEIDDNNYYNDNDDDEVVVRPDGTVIVVKNNGANTNAGGNGATHQIATVRRPHKSMEFLLDKENQKNVLPPENELQKSHDHNSAALSEHQLRIQASLQRLNIPDWFRQYNQNQSRSPEGAANTSSYRPGNFTRKRAQDSGRWAGLNSKTTSLSSLGSQRSDRSPLLLSPSAHSHHGGQTSLHTHHIQNANVSAGSGGAGTFSRWSTSHLNSSQISPSVSQRGSFSRGGPINSSFMSVSSGHSAIRNSMRQPYMGWRSQEKLSQRTAHERLASSLLAQQQRTSPSTRTTILTNVSNGSGNNKLPPLVTPEIQTSIKEVTSAIVHYVNDQTNQQRSRSTSPNSSYL